MKYKDLTGKRYGRLVVLNTAGRSSAGYVLWRCKCDCGNLTTVISASLLGGYTTSCGCAQKEAAAKTGRSTATHHLSKTRLYRVWRGMKTRVYNPKNEKYPVYGGRGIGMCEEWRDSFEAFKAWADDNGYDENAEFGECTIDRIDVDGDYEPANCRWVSLKVQAGNKRRPAYGK